MAKQKRAPSTPAPSRYVIKFPSDWWHGVAEKAITDHGHFSNAFTVHDKSAMENLGICLISTDDKCLNYAGFIHWGNFVCTGKRIARIFAVVSLGVIQIPVLGHSASSTVGAFLCNTDDRCDASKKAIPLPEWMDLLLAISNVAAGARKILDQLEAQLVIMQKHYQDKSIERIAQERDAILLTCKAANIDADKLVALSYPPNEVTATPLVRKLGNISEYAMQAYDVDAMHKVFRRYAPSRSIDGCSFSDGDKRITVVNVDSGPIEHKLGVDLCIYHEEFHSYAMVQYKAMEIRIGKHSNDFVYHDDKNCRDELARMFDLVKRMDPIFLSAWFCGNIAEDYRIGANCFFFKFCNRIAYKPSERSLLPGIYLPADFVQHLFQNKGEITGETRSFSNDLFLSLFRRGWIGSRSRVTDMINAELNNILQVPDDRQLILAMIHRHG